MKRTVPLLGVVIVALAAVNAALAPASQHRSRPSHSIFWGATFPGNAPWDWGPVARFEGMVKKTASIVGVGAPFANCTSGSCSYNTFPITVMRRVRAHGAIPFVSWDSAPIPVVSNEGDFSDQQVASGRYDSVLRAFAESAKAWGQPFFLRFDWEMNGTWWPWGNAPASFVAMWRHVHNIFTQVGATNVNWVWCPNIDPTHTWKSIARFYPGSRYVDWTCLDGYNWGSKGPRSRGARRGGWTGFDRLYHSSYVLIRHIAPSKPMVLGEVSSSRDGGSQASWIHNMFSLLPRRYSHVYGFLWYDLDGGWDFGIRPGNAAKAFSAGVRTRSYAGNVFCRLGGRIHPAAYPAPRSPFCARS